MINRKVTEIILFGEICNKCRTRNCCTYLGSNNYIASPFLAKVDIERISRFTKLSQHDFCKVLRNGDDFITVMKLKKNRCIFSDTSGGCQIYGYHPIDCRLYPLDVEWDKGKYVWIIYEHLCNYDDINLEMAMRSAEKSLLSQLSRGEFESYSEYGSKMLLYRKRNWIRLRQVFVSEITWAKHR